jgi:hypothetical protein
VYVTIFLYRRLASPPLFPACFSCSLSYFICLGFLIFCLVVGSLLSFFDLCNPPNPIHKKGQLMIPGNYRMIAVSGTLYRLYANLLRSMVQDWCTKHDKIPDTQFGFFPSRSTLHLLFILVEAHCTCFLSWQKHTAPAFYPGRSTLHPLFNQAEAHCTRFLSWQKHTASTFYPGRSTLHQFAFYPAISQRCSTEEAEGLITTVHSLH